MYGKPALKVGGKMFVCHYKGYPAVLVRLSRITPNLLRDLFGMAYHFLRGSTQSGKRKRLGTV
jgi:hypothetical protein